MHYWYDGGSAPWGMWVAMAVMMTIFVVAVAWVVVTVVRHSGRQLSMTSAAGPPSADAVAILDERFARGEIDADEYRARSEVLRGAHRSNG